MSGTGIVCSIYYMYLCTRKSGYCAGKTAINTLKKSNLAFKNEAIGVSFRSGLCAQTAKIRLRKETIFIYTHYLNY